MKGKNLSRWLHRQQKGALLVLTAVMLPLLLVFTGFAVDFGNMYYQKSRLQNATDAAVLAGSAKYVSDLNAGTAGVTTDAETDPAALEEARSYLTGKNGSTRVNLPADVVITSVSHDSAVIDGNKNLHYSVTAKQQVHLYFLPFLNFLGSYLPTDGVIQAKSTVNIPIVSSKVPSGDFDDLFVVQKGLRNVNSIENPDQPDKAGTIITTFDGGIRYTDGSGKEVKDYQPDKGIQYSTQSSTLDHFFTKKAQDENLSVNGAIGKKDTSYATQASYKAYDMEAFGRYVDTLTQIDAGTNQSMNSNSFTVYDSAFNTTTPSSALHFYKDHENGQQLPNLNITIDKELPGSNLYPDAPIILNIDDSVGLVNIHVNASNKRPLIVCTHSKSVHIEYQDSQNRKNDPITFRGVIYAPDSEDTHINVNHGVFSGSIVTSYLDLEGGAGTYRFESLLNSIVNNTKNGGSSGSILYRYGHPKLING